MMHRTYINEVKKHVGEEVTVQGWVQAMREMGGLVFIVVRDVTGVTQGVVTDKQSDVSDQLSELTLESVVEVKGTVKADERAPDGVELQVSNLTVLSKADPVLPIPVVTEKGGEETEASKRYDWRWIDLRKEEKREIFRIWTELEKGMRIFFNRENFIQVYGPSFMSTSSESGAELFEVKYFDRVAYLAQSPQFYKQMAMAAGFERVFMVGPVFRAEPSFTTRHATEYTGWDFEVSFVESHHDVMGLEEEMLVQGFEQVNKALNMDVVVPSRPFPRITMQEAKEKLKAAGVKSEKEGDVSPEEERVLSEIIKEETGHDFVFLIDWPIETRPFYHMRHENNPQLTKSFDLLYKGIEVTTGSQREHRVDYLERQAQEKGMDVASLEHYFDFFRYGCPPHGGVGIGPVRIIMKMLNLPNIREATFVPRDVNRLTP